MNMALSITRNQRGFFFMLPNSSWVRAKEIATFFCFSLECIVNLFNKVFVLMSAAFAKVDAEIYVHYHARLIICGGGPYQTEENMKVEVLYTESVGCSIVGVKFGWLTVIH